MANAGDGSLGGVVLIAGILGCQNVLGQHGALGKAVHRLQGQAHKLRQIGQLFFRGDKDHRRSVEVGKLADILLFPDHMRQGENELLDRIELRAEARQSAHLSSCVWNM